MWYDWNFDVHLLSLGVVADTTGEAHKNTGISNGPSLEEPFSQEMPQQEPNVSAGGPHHVDDHHVSNLELENTLLRKEVASLNEEMVSVVQRAKEAERSKFGICFHGLFWNENSQNGNDQNCWNNQTRKKTIVPKMY